jgi:hypothetical protein
MYQNPRVEKQQRMIHEDLTQTLLELRVCQRVKIQAEVTKLIEEGLSQTNK